MIIRPVPTACSHCCFSLELLALESLSIIMNSWKCLGSMVAAGSTLVSPIGLMAMPATAQTAAPTLDKSVNLSPPGEASAPKGAWVPVARVNPAQPIQLNLVNKTGQTLEYLITTHTNARTLDAGKSVVLTSFQPPIFLNINAPDQAGTLKYQVSTQKNQITVEVVPIGQFGDHTLNIAETGAIYLY
jgi:hypothetical protein